MGSEPLSVIFGAERQPSVAGNGQAAPSRPDELGRSPARTRRAPLPRGAGAFSPDAPLTTNPISNPGGAAAHRYRAAATAPCPFSLGPTTFDAHPCGSSLEKA